MHANAKLTPAGRKVLIERIRTSGRPIAHIATEMGISRKTAYKWWQRWLAKGDVGLEDGSSRPHRCPSRVPRSVQRRICRLRRRRKLGPDRIAPLVGVPASTVHRVLVRHGLNRLAWMDRPTGRVLRRIHNTRPGELVHMDVKKLGRIPDGGGWRAHGRGATNHKRTRTGYAFVHSVVDGFSRLAYSEVLADEQKVTVVAFWTRAVSFFAAHGVSIGSGPHRQRSRLPQPRLRPGMRYGRHPPPAYPALSAPDQRQGRTLQPDPARRVGLRSLLSDRTSPQRRPCPLAPHLQPSPLPHRSWRRHPHEPCHQPVGRTQLGLVRLPAAESAGRSSFFNLLVDNGGTRA